MTTNEGFREVIPFLSTTTTDTVGFLLKVTQHQHKPIPCNLWDSNIDKIRSPRDVSMSSARARPHSEREGGAFR